MNISGADAYDHLKDVMGRFRTQSLFTEMKVKSYPAPFTLKDKDYKGALSMYRLYMEYGDPTEYSQAIGLLGSLRHWELLTSRDWFKPYITRWRDELRVRTESERFKEMKNINKTIPGTPQAIQATKWLAERYGEKKPAPKRGRPSKDEKDVALRQMIEEETTLLEEALRLGLPTD